MKPPQNFLEALLANCGAFAYAQMGFELIHVGYKNLVVEEEAELKVKTLGIHIMDLMNP